MDIFKRSIMLGLGLITLTKEKAEEFMNELMEKGKMSKDEAQKFLDDLITKGKSQKEELKAEINAELQKIIKELNLVTREELKLLENRLNELETKIQEQNKG
ncbi:phasin family protein [Carboxydothermus pertinax]|uniref:Polyhydroxyalkanoate synthesis regulator n=1 Tax=Carboxydothermus pertinax TaxID=870242 RepID=A0A1L8CU79_9THEO|nr:hypothetical protein [Carboxydothermus pertinax]GAV22478.1 hypothetical protein cpu_09880 [Carboxydothermus pertinax]